MEVSVKFCSECAYAKIQEFQEGFKIVYTRPFKRTYKAGLYKSGYNFYRKYNASACAHYKEVIKDR